MCLSASCSHSLAIALATGRIRPPGRSGYRTLSRSPSGALTSFCKLLLREEHIYLLNGALNSSDRPDGSGKCHSDSAIENSCSRIQMSLTRLISRQESPLFLRCISLVPQPLGHGHKIQVRGCCDARPVWQCLELPSPYGKCSSRDQIVEDKRLPRRHLFSSPCFEARPADSVSPLPAHSSICHEYSKPLFLSRRFMALNLSASKPLLLSTPSHL